MQHIVKNGQWLGDIALQSSGDIASLFEIALQNGKSITEDLAIDEELKINLTITNKSVKNYYITKEIEPATAISKAVVEECAGGIGCMQIEVSFIVSGELTQGIGDMEIEQTLVVN
jgi:hypothetical protein